MARRYSGSVIVQSERMVANFASWSTTGAWSVRVTGPAPGAIRTVSVVSSTGAVALASGVTVTN